MINLDITPVWSRLYQNPPKKVLEVSQEVFDMVNSSMNLTAVETDYSSGNPLSLEGYQYYSDKDSRDEEYLVSESKKSISKTYYFIYPETIISHLIQRRLADEAKATHHYYTLVEYYITDKKGVKSYKANFMLHLDHEINSLDLDLLSFFYTSTKSNLKAVILDYRELDK